LGIGIDKILKNSQKDAASIPNALRLTASLVSDLDNNYTKIKIIRDLRRYEVGILLL